MLIPMILDEFDFFSNSIFRLSFLSVVLALFLTVVLGRSGCNDGSAFTMCSTWASTYLTHLIVSIIITAISFGSFLGVRNFIESRKAVLIAGIILLILTGGFLQGQTGGQNTIEREEACKAAMNAQCSVDQRQNVEIPANCKNAEGEILEGLRDQIEVQNGTVECDTVP